MTVLAAHAHAVDVYVDEAALVHEVARFAAEGVLLGESVILVATATHLAAIEGILREAGLSSGVRTLDAADLLASFMVADAPDPLRFRAVVGGVVTAALREQRPVRVFGEMVALLWAHGNVAAALALEELWNDLATTRAFALRCAYPRTALDGASLAEADSMCRQHVRVRLLGETVDGAAASDEVSRLFVPVPAAVGMARRFVASALLGWGLTDVLDDAAVVVSELATNAVQHAVSAFRVVVARGESTVRISVADTASLLPAAGGADATTPAGRGLLLVQRVARDWGWTSAGDGKSVWADLSI